MMAVEIAADVVRECTRCDPDRQEHEPQKEPEVKRVDIV